MVYVFDLRENLTGHVFTQYICEWTIGAVKMVRESKNMVV